MLKRYRITTSGYTYTVDHEDVHERLRYIVEQNKKYGERVVRVERLDDPEEPEENSVIATRDFYSQVASSLMEIWPRQVAKSITNRMRRRRNSSGVGFLGPVIEEENKADGKIAYSRRNIEPNNTARRTATKLCRFVKDFTGFDDDDGLARLQEVFSNSFTTIKLLSGQEAADIYHLPYGEPFRSCMQRGYHEKHGKREDFCGHQNDHLFLMNPDKLFMAVAYKGGKLAARAKVYKNDDGTQFVSRQYGIEGIFDHLHTGNLNCTLNHNIGEMMPYLDREYVTRISDTQVRFSKEGYSNTHIDGSDETHKKDCECGRTYPARKFRKGVCPYCFDSKYILLNGDYVLKTDCYKWNDTYVLRSMCVLALYNGSLYHIPRYECFEHDGYFYHIGYLMDYLNRPIWFSAAKIIEEGPFAGLKAHWEKVEVVNGKTQLKAEYV